MKEDGYVGVQEDCGHNHCRVEVRHEIHGGHPDPEQPVQLVQSPVALVKRCLHEPGVHHCDAETVPIQKHPFSPSHGKKLF